MKIRNYLTEYNNAVMDEGNQVTTESMDNIKMLAEYSKYIYAIENIEHTLLNILNKRISPKINCFNYINTMYKFIENKKSIIDNLFDPDDKYNSFDGARFHVKTLIIKSDLKSLDNMKKELYILNKVKIDYSEQLKKIKSLRMLAGNILFLCKISRKNYDRRQMNENRS